MNVKEIIKEYLERKGYAGLFNEDVDCGCEINDLMPCDSNTFDCQPGYKFPCPGDDNCGMGEDCKFHIGLANENAKDKTN